MKRAERPASRNASGRPSRFEVDRQWLWRGIVAALAVAMLLLVAKVSMMAFGGASKRLERFDPGHEPSRATAHEPDRTRDPAR